MSPPLLIVLTGMPASGKTTLARELARRLELAQRYASGQNGPVELEGELIDLDTSEPVDVQSLAARVRSAL